MTTAFATEAAKRLRGQTTEAPLSDKWMIQENHSFSVCEQGRLRKIFEYLNPLVKITDANIARPTIRCKVISAYETHKSKVAEALRQSSGQIHVSFDG
ncbi:polyprotein [Metarhizium robertsii ARSEF 23]|uniref:Polyprotein n=1 Tax=Metarhizium robertsii (strain ARSEF 23 / ATCC MYA-3075) TaxID=655844 RepID=A0A0B2X917_METRA|nr:polyprotein [Metarhizium robertsii ARSEF 23]KHO11388.1 polyprotein [Metarhizium robertsii ARSEF 23]